MVIKTNSFYTVTICYTVVVGTISFSQIRITASVKKTIKSFLPWLVYPYEKVMFTEQFPHQPVYNFSGLILVSVWKSWDQWV